MTTYRTKRELRFSWTCNRTSYDLVIPAHTRCVPIPSGTTAGDFWVDDLSWIPPQSGFLKHDATHYGIVIKADEVEEL